MKKIVVLAMLFSTLNAKSLKLTMVNNKMAESSKIVINNREVVCSCGRQAVDVRYVDGVVEAYCIEHSREHEKYKELETLQKELEEFDEALAQYLKEDFDLEKRSEGGEEA